MPPPVSKADEFRIHPDQDAAYRALEEAAKKGLKPQKAIWKRYQAARKMLSQDPLWGDVIRSSAKYRRPDNNSDNPTRLRRAAEIHR